VRLRHPPSPRRSGTLDSAPPGGRSALRRVDRGRSPPIACVRCVPAGQGPAPRGARVLNTSARCRSVQTITPEIPMTQDLDTHPRRNRVRAAFRPLLRCAAHVARHLAGSAEKQAQRLRRSALTLDSAAGAAGAREVRPGDSFQFSHPAHVGFEIASPSGPEAAHALAQTLAARLAEADHPSSPSRDRCRERPASRTWSCGGAPSPARGTRSSWRSAADPPHGSNSRIS
jgi:hypothetical protein